MKRLSPAIRATVKAELQKGRSSRHIAIQCGIGKSSVNRIRDGLEGLPPPKAGGRPPELSKRDTHIITRTIRTQKVDSARQALRELSANGGPSVHVDTARRALRRQGLTAAVKVNRPLLTRKHKAARLRFAREHQEWTVDDWARVVWSDETKVNRLGSDGRHWVWLPEQRENTGLPQRRINGKVKFGGGNVMVWGCMTWSGPGTIELVKGRMDSKQYTEILDRKLLPFLDALSITPGNPDRDKLLFQQDNDPKHTSKWTKSWFNRHKLKPITWPANSPDLNPIEHLWLALKRRLARYETDPKGATELWDRVQKEWEQLTAAEGQKLIQSMPRRCAAVVQAKGGNTKY